MLGQVPVCKNQVIQNFPEVVHVGECLATVFSVSRVFKLSPVCSSNYVSEVYILKKCSDIFSEKNLTLVKLSKELLLSLQSIIVPIIVHIFKSNILSSIYS